MKLLAPPYFCSFTMTSPRAGVPTGYFRRTLADGRVVDYAMEMREDDQLASHVLRSLCARLEIDPAVFGYTLGPS